MKPPSMEFMPLVNELRGLIEQARQHVAQTANSTLTLLHWKLGARIQGEILQGARARQAMAKRFCRHCRQNWFPSTARASVPGTCPG